ncbi:glutamyl-tRNA(Gln) amidotransferase subunit C, mitochondrial [Lethenteron reissneri]|uniref:glutamyl-tRNA(Gln) amidotransferase subunit C, mitochondrial n=1 Tax=Lethenteron reissneri TaxID=7753 RepID=UPI002AB707A5|nr:glutamyl-tRNA(Gln) amidotransferase subunit C, mitochondrial [Lethenteron reissneri]XP_061403137.1 glutamyl-tRNA(Gln) amidotransferase subunit C, mitochondrial [Lethenteron reissneri]
MSLVGMVSAVVRRRALPGRTGLTPLLTSAPHRCQHSSTCKVPQQPTWQPAEEPPCPEVEVDLLGHLEHQGLVAFGSREASRRLADAVSFAQRLQDVDTHAVSAMVSGAHRGRSLWLRSDEVTEGGHVDEVMANARHTEDDYFVAPPGNIPLSGRPVELGAGHDEPGRRPPHPAGDLDEF